jgi:predicted Zn finger-like uncharacterized protein
MKFTCDSCGSAYMISDDKVGPGGVKVRCKKCGNVVTVKRAEEPPVVAPAAAPAAPPAGLDDELGSAFDHAFGDAPAPAAAEDAPAPGPAPAAAPAQGALPATEWYVAIGEAQVGPLPLAEVKKKWEAGQVGPDSLVWRPGMADWGPLSGVPDLAAYLAPVPQPARPQAAPAASVSPVAAPAPAPHRAATPAAGVPAAAPAAPGPEVDWKPSGASALAALASEEMASREAPAPAAPRPAPARSLMEQLPDSGGVDPTGAIPLPIKGMEKTEERPVRRSSVARGAEQVRHKRTVRNVVTVVVVLVAVAAGAGYGVYTFAGREPARPPPPAPVAAVPAPAPAPAPAAATPPPPAAAPAATPPPPVEPAPAAAAAAAPTKAEPPKAEPPPPEPAKPAPPPREPVKVAAKPPPAPRPALTAAPKPAPPPAEKPATAPKKKDSVLDFDQGAEDDLTAALGGGGRSVYVPPKPGGSTASDRLSDAQITESVKLHVDALRRCASEQQAREPGAKGTLKMAWTIQPDGAPKDVRCLTPDLAASPFAQCITGVVKGIRFPRIGDPKGQPVTFPFGF